jgi:hypothetical protein
MSFTNHLTPLSERSNAAIALLAEIDPCFLIGFAHLEEKHLAVIDSLQRIFQGTPLRSSLEAMGKALSNYEFTPSAFVTLAVARASILGALSDELQQQVQQALGRLPLANSLGESPSIGITEPVGDSESNSVHAQMDSIQHWLMEVAISGFTRLGTSTWAPFLPTLETLQSDPKLIRSAALLTGLIDEFSTHLPAPSIQDIPQHRWVDLWTQTMLSILRSPSNPQNPQSVAISGNLQLLGLDIRHHVNLVSLIAYGVLTASSSSNNSARSQLVRITLSRYYVPAITGDEIWLLFADAKPLFEALAQQQTLQLEKAQLLPTGDLLWDINTVNATLGEAYDLLKLATAFSLNPDNSADIPISCTIAPGDRHPTQLAEPVFLAGYKVINQNDLISLTWDGHPALNIAMERLSPLSAIAAADLLKSTQMFGLLRFDAGHWSMQPLFLTIKSKRICPSLSAIEILNKPPATNKIAVLKERAGRLLRKSTTSSKSQSDPQGNP